MTAGHAIRDSGWNGTHPLSNPESYTVTCTCGETFTRYLRADATAAWKEHRDEGTPVTAHLHLMQNRSSIGGDTLYEPSTWSIRCVCGWHIGGGTSQEGVDAALAAHIEARRVGTTQARFLAFHADHPEVLAGLVALAARAYGAGASRVGLRMLFEVMRWEWTLGRLPAEDEVWKLNNNYAPWYARLIMAENPWAKGLFELRRIRTP